MGYPIRLERWLMEGSYDRVWNAMKKGEVPCEEFGVFSDVRNLRLPPKSQLEGLKRTNRCSWQTQILTFQIRSEIASSSERAYPSLPLSSTKSLLFLDSEGAVIDFASSRGWIIRDGTIYFPSANAAQAISRSPITGRMLIGGELVESLGGRWIDPGAPGLVARTVDAVLGVRL